MRDRRVIRIAGPRNVFVAIGQRIAHRVQAFDEIAIRTKHVEHRLSDAGHDAHVDHDVRGVRDFHANARDLGSNRAHAERNDIHGPPAHAAAVKATQLLFHHGRVFPIVGWTGVIFQSAANEGPFFHPGHIARVGADKEAIGALLFIEANGGAGFDHQLTQALVFFL